MIPEILKEPFYINRTDKPLYLILRHQFHYWILKSEHNMRFPSERELAAEIKVNRRTIRKALEPFLESGRLVRRGKETYVNHKKAENNTPRGAYNKVTGSMNKSMTLLLPETKPDQINFWNSLIEKFNQLVPTVHLKAQYCNNFESIDTSYWDYFQSGNFDLAVMPTPISQKKSYLDQLMPVKPSWKKLFHSDEFLSGMLNETLPLQNEYAYTYMFTFQRVQWLKQFHLFDGVSAGNMPMEEMLRKVNQFLPEKYPVFNLYYDICRDLGVPVDFTPEIIREHCNIVFDRLELVKERKKVFMTNEISYGILNGNSEMNVFYVPSYSNSVFSTGITAEEQYISSIYHNPRKDCYYWGGSGMIGIGKHSENIHHALLFIEYLLSKSVQDEIWTKLHSAPVRTESISTVDIAPEKELLKYFARCRQNPTSYPTPVGCAMMPYFEQYLNGTITKDKVIQNVLRFYE